MSCARCRLVANSNNKTPMLDVVALQSMGRDKLLRNFTKLVREDWETTADMLAYIGEIDRRKLYLEDAYPSMFAFCTRHFGMSEAIAGKRIRAGRAACRFPCILDMVRRGELHLSGVHQLAGHLTESNFEEVLQRARHRSMREIEVLIAEISPRPDPGSMLRALAPEDAVGDPSTGGSSPDSSDEAHPIDLSSAELWAGTPANSLKNLTIPLSPRRYRLHVTIGQSARDALEELQGLLSHQIPDGDPALIVEHALAALLADTKKKRAAITNRPQKKRKGVTKRTRVIPAHVRREVFKRDEGRCAFVDGNGRRCNSAWQVEFHHLKPYGRDGPHTVENIELRCRAHNQHEAELEFGKAFMESKRRSA